MLVSLLGHWQQIYNVTISALRRVVSNSFGNQKVNHKRNKIWSDVLRGLTVHFHTFLPWPIHCNSLMFSCEMSIRSESCRTYLDPGPAFEACKPSGEAELYGLIKRWGHLIRGYHYTRAKTNREVLFLYVSMWS